MKDLEYFRTHQNDAPFWAIRKNKYLKGTVVQAPSARSIGDKRILKQGSVVFDDPGQPLDQTVVWGNEIEVPQDESYLIVDGVRIDLPKTNPYLYIPKAHTQPKKNEVPTTATFSSATTSENASQSIGSNRYSFANTSNKVTPKETSNTLSVSAVDSNYHPPGISFIGVSSSFGLGPNGFEEYKTGTVMFENGHTMSISEYDALSKEQRIQYDEMPASQPKF